LHKAYFAAVADMVATLRPQIVGHLDLIRKFDGPAADFAADVWPLIDRALETICNVEAALDVNAAPARKGLGPVYPLPAILKRARQLNIRVTLGDDSHAVADVGVGLGACLQAITAAGYDQVSYLVHCDDGVEWRDAPI
jgi:histidinol-phosphatase (PHP family)